MEQLSQYIECHKKSGQILYRPDVLNKSIHFVYPSMSIFQRGGAFRSFRSRHAAMKFIREAV